MIKDVIRRRVADVGNMLLNRDVSHESSNSRVKYQRQGSREFHHDPLRFGAVARLDGPG